MYDFTPTEEQQMLIEAVARYARADLRPAGPQAEESRELPARVIEKGWSLGVLQGSVPEAYGGFGERSAVTGVLAAEQLAWGDLAGSIALLSPALFVLPILMLGNEEQKRQFIPPAVSGEWRPYASALIEPVFDFDPNELKTVARADGDEYVLEGEKAWVAYGAESPALVVYASLEGGTQAFIVDRGTPGVEIGAERERLMSLNALPLYRIKLQGARVPASRLLGGAGVEGLASLIAAHRLANAALGIGVAQAAFEYARDYAKEREAFGVKIAQKQAIAFMLAEMATEIEAMRLLTWEAAWKQDAGKEDAGRAAYLASTGAADMAMMVTDRAVQILGGHGYIRDHPVEMWMRNARGFSTFTGLAAI